MGYFSNGTEGMIYEEMYCDKCEHQPDCAVWFAHLCHNYDEAKKKESILDMLIPRKEGVGNEKCKMFINKRKSVTENMIESAEEHLNRFRI